VLAGAEAEPDVDVVGVVDGVGVVDVVGEVEVVVSWRWSVSSTGAPAKRTKTACRPAATGTCSPRRKTGSGRATGTLPLGSDEGGDTDDVTAAGVSCRCVGEWLIEFTAKAVAPPAPTMPPRMSASTSGFTRRRRGGGWLMPDAIGGGVAGG